MKQINIVGAGFAGLAVGWHLLDLFGNSLKITYYDPFLGKGGASGIAAGLLHKFGSLDAKKPPLADQAFSMACKLIEEASLYSRPILKKGIVRQAFSPRQERSFLKAQKKYPKEVFYLSKEETKKLEPALFTAPSLFIPEGLAIDSPIYLKGLIEAMKQRQAAFIEKEFSLASDKAIKTPTILACGSSIFTLTVAKDLSINPVKGQLLTFSWPKNHPPLNYAANSRIYAVPKSCNKLIAGATFERGNCDPSVDAALAKEKIVPPLFEMIPLLKGLEPTDYKAAIRVAAKDHLPIAKKIRENLWYFGALGSKGLLYHAYYGKLLAKEIYLESLKRL